MPSRDDRLADEAPEYEFTWFEWCFDDDDDDEAAPAADDDDVAALLSQEEEEEGGAFAFELDAALLALS